MPRIVITTIISVAVMGSTVGSTVVGATATIVNCATGSCIDNVASIPPIGALGCIPPRPRASGTSVETIATDDGLRTYLLHVPPSYTGFSAMPVVLNMHGAGLNAAVQEWYSGFSAKADAEGFIVVYPEGMTTAALSFTHFNAWMLPSPEPDDVAFISTLIDALEVQLCVDHDRVFSTGFSNGAMMSVRLACSLSNRIAAIAPVAGAYYPQAALDLNAAETCSGATPVPVIAFHGTADAAVPFGGGEGDISGVMVTFRLPIDDAAAAEDAVGDWSAHNGCTSGRQELQVDTEVRLIRYDACTAGATVELYAVGGGGHTWPGSFDIPPAGYTTHQISATDRIWAFFSGYPPAPPAPVGGIAEQPDVMELPSASASSRDHAAYILGTAFAIIVAAAGAAGWRKRRRWPRTKSA